MKHTLLALNSLADIDTTVELTELVTNLGMLLHVDQFADHCVNNVLERWELLVSWMSCKLSRALGGSDNTPVRCPNQGQRVRGYAR
ncbi:unnamed protein product [Phytophthora fragariaefolia]|uniref:Unnamed protein product n=1 Tax=Phytophthora fragariaefolia TaxID=1490495 RepID=A0A9W6XCG1_9STRA|nr:unnamed protein product [Phytophthora fragariaefolia]